MIKKFPNNFAQCLSQLAKNAALSMMKGQHVGSAGQQRSKSVHCWGLECACSCSLW